MQPGWSDSRSHPLHHSHRSPGHDGGQEEGTLAGMPWGLEIRGTSLRSPGPADVHTAASCSTQRPSVRLLGLWCGTRPAARACSGMEVTAAKAHTGCMCGQTRLSWPRATSSLVCCRLVKSNTPVCLPRNPWQAGEAGLWASHTGTGGTW